MIGPLCLTRPSSVSQLRLSPSKSGITPLKTGDNTQCLRVVIEAAEAGEAVVERAFAGMAEQADGQGHAPAPAPRPRSSSRPRARASERAICATSSVCVSRVR